MVCLLVCLLFFSFKEHSLNCTFDVYGVYYQYGHEPYNLKANNIVVKYLVQVIVPHLLR